MEKSVIIAASARSGSSGRHVAGRGLRALLAAMTMVIAPLAMATPGEDGDITWTAGSGGVYAPNSYTTLQSVAGTTITVASVADLALPACPSGATCNNEQAPTAITGATAGYTSGLALGPGDLLMIYQPQDRNAAATTIDITNAATFGAVLDNTTAAHQAGLYEFVYVRSVSGNDITFVTTGTPVSEGGSSACTGLVNTYDTVATAGAGNGAMVIRVPQLRNLTLGSNHVFSPPAWNGTTGGVIALEVGRRAGATPPADTGGVLSFQGTAAIHADGDGFRGGSTAQANVANVNATGTPSTAFFETLCGRGRKGESIFGWSGQTNDTGTSTPNNSTSICSFGATGLHVGRAMARGALANGGGGGNPHNGGGGGGANGGLIGGWNGGGNPAAGFAAQWDLEDDSLPTTSAAGGPLVISTSTSSGGGRGGYTSSGATSNTSRNSTNQGPQVSPTPNCGTGTNSWGGDCRKNQGGLGGRPLDRGADGVQPPGSWRFRSRGV